MSTLTFVSSVTSAGQFTGLEQTSIMNLLTILALISVAMWTIVSLSIIARLFAKLIIHRLQKRILPNKESQTM